MTYIQQRRRERGGVSLFVVIFATLLMLVITISFVQLMVKDQQQATASDLSRSAYDSAQSGVEDAKRLLLLDQQCRDNVAPAAVDCAAVARAISSGECNTVAMGLHGAQSAETVIQQNVGDKQLDQAYTCVKINPNPMDYRETLDENSSSIVPLKAADASGRPTQFDSVKLSWFTQGDMAGAADNMTIGFPASGPQVDLPRVDEWAENNPALIRVQLMQTGASFKLSDADNSQPGNKSNANTLFLYPSGTVGVTTMSFALDARRTPPNAPQQVKCITSFSRGQYACSVTLTLPAPIDGNDGVDRNAFLRLGALYNGAHYKVELLKAGVPQHFDHVQPEVDSTGRANDMFRRVKSRVEFKSDFIYPEAAIDLEGDLCKSFAITSRDADYTNSLTCTP